MGKILRTLRISRRTALLTVHVLIGIVLALLFVNRELVPGSRASRLTLWWHGRACRIFGAKVSISGDVNKAPTLFVSNHISWFDIPALGACLSAHFLSKDEVAAWPVVGWFAARTGTLYIRRGAKGASQRSTEDIRNALSQGGNVILFAEGTTSDGRSVRKFHSRLMQAAIDAGADVQPLAITYPHELGVHPYAPFIDDTNLAESAGGIMGGPPMQVNIMMMPAFNATNYSRDQLAQMCEQQVRAQVERAHAVNTATVTPASDAIQRTTE